jgi:ubiquitin-like modifier-activating enzyme ATG7
MAEPIRRPPSGAVPLQGVFKNLNTIEEFRATDPKKDLFNSVVDSVRTYPLHSSWRLIGFVVQIVTSFSTDNPVLNPFLLVTFADLKKYVYHYWFAFPALVAKPAWDISEPGLQALDDEVSMAARQCQEADECRKCRRSGGSRSSSSRAGRRRAKGFWSKVPEDNASPRNSARRPTFLQESQRTRYVPSYW